MKASDGVESLGHLLWGTRPREGAGPAGPCGGLQEDAPCLSSGAGLVLKQKLSLIHPPCGRSFKTKAAFDAEDAEDADAISLPTASSLCVNNTAFNPPPKRLGLPRLSLTDAARHPAAAQSPCTTAPSWSFTQLRPNFQPALARGLLWRCCGDIPASPRGTSFGSTPCREGKDDLSQRQTKPLGYPGIEGGLHPTRPPQSHPASRLRAPGVRAANPRCLRNPALLGWIFLIGL